MRNSQHQWNLSENKKLKIELMLHALCEFYQKTFMRKDAHEKFGKGPLA